MCRPNTRTGNRCGHNPETPRLIPAKPIRKGKGGLPRILSLAAERAKAWYRHPHQCPLLIQPGQRATRSERREAYQVIIETVLSLLDLTSLCLGTPTLEHGFIDVDMQTIGRTSGMSQRRCERAIAMLKQTGMMEIKQPRKQNEQGDYVGLRAIRVVTSVLFDCLGLGPMLQRERARASEVQGQTGKSEAGAYHAAGFCWSEHNAKPCLDAHRRNSTQSDEARERIVREWNNLWSGYVMQGLDPPEAQRLANFKMGLPPDFSPGKLSLPDC